LIRKVSLLITFILTITLICSCARYKREIESLATLIPDVKELVHSNTDLLMDVQRLIADKEKVNGYIVISRKGDNTISLYRDMFRDDELLIESDQFTDDEKTKIESIFYQSSGRVTLQDIASGQFTFARVGRVSLRVLYLGELSSKTVFSDDTESNLEEVIDGWYVVIIHPPRAGD